MEQLTFSLHSQTSDQVMSALDTDAGPGLSPGEAEQQLDRFGLNQLVEQPRPGFWQLLIAQFNNFVVMILVAAAAISFILGLREFSESGEITEFIEAGAIVAIVIPNAIIGVVQESKAEEALAALRKTAAPDARVIRGGHRAVIPARELVPVTVRFLVKFPTVGQPSLDIDAFGAEVRDIPAFYAPTGVRWGRPEIVTKFRTITYPYGTRTVCW